MNRIIFSLLIATFSTLTANLLSMISVDALLTPQIDIIVWFACIWSIQIGSWMYREETL